MLDDLRQAAQSRADTPERKPKEAKLFGMTAVERAFLSIVLFGIVTVVSFMMLLLTNSIAF